MVDGAGKTWTYASDGSHRFVSVTDPLSHVVEAFTYDGSNRVQTFQRDAGNEALTFTYTSPSQTSVTNSLGNTTTFTLDTLQRRGDSHQRPGVCLVRDGSQREPIVRDGYLNKTQITDGNGNITNQTFDSWGDVLTKTEAFGTALQPARPLTPTIPPTNFVLHATVPSVDTSGHNRVATYTYNAGNGNLLTENLSGYSNGSAFSYTTTYTYDSHGQVQTMTARERTFRT